MDISDQISKKLYLSEKRHKTEYIKNRSKKEAQFNINLTLMETTISFLQRIKFDWHAFMSKKMNHDFCGTLWPEVW